MKDDARKSLRVGHVTERAAVNAVRSILEKHGLVVDEVDGRSDYGRDLNVDLVEANKITGGVIGVQVKGGRSFQKNGRWFIPATPTDWDYWRSSTLPVIGMTWDPDSGQIRWINLSQFARSKVWLADDSYDSLTVTDGLREVTLEDILEDSTFDQFFDKTVRYLGATSSTALLSLLDDDESKQREGIFNAWTLGRRDARALILLRQVLSRLEGTNLLDAINILAHATAHPDIFWHRQNWIPREVEEEVQRSFVWTPDEIVSLVHQIEVLDPEILTWERGGVGQSLWSILIPDPNLTDKLRRCVRRAVEIRQLDTALRVLICYQWCAEDPEGAVVEILQTVPELQSHGMINEVIRSIEEHGRIPVY